ncbi:SEC10/PgrA surface exclusion domain-containing protein [Lactobacillus johnsonii]|uniref:SEC10/PgrA surface exclusion domain-containing protein n=1 Tax=Lactobacillus johnsonii TaxID=33959 RepID=UPI0021A8BAC1|nr:SEC10/PgrA surface exclusion domain-containing protein [Lactobacillus johnsonii]MCT3342946.1 SEC10/PgrA surface exclusion domain-containing protein [Lactobacillus johnsonii]
MKRRTAMLLSALFAAGAIATYSNTAKADTITQPKGQIPEANIETKSTNEGLQQKQVQLGARKSPDLNQKTNKNISTTPVQNNQQLHITHQVEHNNNNWYQMQNKSWLPSSYTTDVKQKQSVQAKQNVQNAQPVQNSNTQTQAQSQNNWHKESADFVTGGVINLRTAPNTNSAIIEAMPTGSTIKYDAYQKIDQYTWLRQPRENGSYGYIVGRNNGVAWGTFKESATKPVESKPAAKPVQSQNNWHRESADFVTGGVINLRTAPNTNSAIIETMPTGSTIKYDAYQKIGQYTWLRQPRENGSYGYIVGRNNGVAWGTFKESTAKPVQSQSNWHKESADFVTGGVINLRTAPNTNSAIIETMPTGSTIKYDAYQKIGQYTWLRQPRENGSYGYIVGRDNGVAWGTFKESATKPVESKPATKPVESKPATKPVESKPVTKPVESKPATKPVESKPVTKPVENKPATKPVENKPATKPVENKPVTKPVENKPATKPVDNKPATKPVDNKPATKPVESKPATKPVESKPATKPVDNKPATNEENIGIIKLPAGYTREMIEDCSGGQDGGDDTKSTLTPLARELSKEGIKMNMNSYRNSDSREVDLTNITPEQARELTDFTLNTINHVRKQMGLKPYMYSERTQKIANNIAKNYVKDNRDATGGHDCVAITDAMRQDHALDSITKSVSNPVENMGAWYIDTNTVNGDKNHETMGSIKEKLYFNIEQMLFGGYTNGIVGEMYHARSLTNPVTTHLGAMYGFSISKIPNSNVVTSHFITFSNFDGFDEFLPDFHD